MKERHGSVFLVGVTLVATLVVGAPPRSAASSESASARTDAAGDPLANEAGDYVFTDAQGQRWRWGRVAPGYGAWALDRRSPDGPLVFAGVPDTMAGVFESNNCQAVGCHVYRMDADGSVETLLRESDGYGLWGVAVSRDARRVAAASVNPDSQSSQGRIWQWQDGKTTARTFDKMVWELGYSSTDSLWAVGGGGGDGLVVTAAVDGTMKVRRDVAPGCSFYALSLLGPRTLVGGSSGTYRLSRRWKGKARKIGPPSLAVWSSRDGRTAVIHPTDADAEETKLLRTDGGGKSWRPQQLVDEVGDGPCDDNSAGHEASDCNDEVQGARLGFEAIVGTSADDLWAVGGRADMPGGRVYRYVGNDRWERVPFPSDIFWASDAVALEEGKPIVATMDGIFQPVPA